MNSLKDTSKFLAKAARDDMMRDKIIANVLTKRFRGSSSSILDMAYLYSNAGITFDAFEFSQLDASGIICETRYWIFNLVTITKKSCKG